MNDPRRIPPRPLDSPQSPAQSNPSDGLDQEALAIIERAAMEMAGRKPSKKETEPIVSQAVMPAHIPDAAPGPLVFAAPSREFEPPVATPQAEPPVAQDDPTESMKPAAEMTADEITEALLGPPDEITPRETPDPVDEVKPAAEIKLVEQFDPMQLIQPAAPAAPEQAAAAPPAFRPMFDDHFRLAFTGLQSAALAIAIFALVIGASGMAAYGWVAAHDWSCRVGFANATCPLAPSPKPLAHPEIPT